jgi:hypothetical protein
MSKFFSVQDSKRQERGTKTRKHANTSEGQTALDKKDLEGEDQATKKMTLRWAVDGKKT